ncbi:unnamed protein product [Brassicogethes aeneus]|uniref:Uncharacterized protein n=1 Tax=Brassicogethes aeneus TaxID=1431903 RepID=A0A9P0ATN8_BRAAE|nr:unnamed protein product [Brassicogethes aeneus]
MSHHSDIQSDFNKQVGEKLKNEVAQRDNTISELKGNMEKLNSLQMENAKEKLSLCYELSEVCNIKEQLSGVLSIEVQKNQALCEAQKDLESTATSQVRQLQEKESAERETLKDLFSELKKVVEERDRLLILQEKYIREIKELKNNVLNVQKKVDALIARTNKKDQKIFQLSESIKASEELCKQTETKLGRDMREFQTTISSLQISSKQLTEQNEELENSVQYLQNNTQRLHSDLNEARKREKDATDNVTKTESINKSLESENIQFQKSIQNLAAEKEKLMTEIEYVNSLCEKVLSDFETSIKSSVEKEEAYKKEIDEYKSLISKFELEFDLLGRNLQLAQTELFHMRTNQNTLDATNENLQTICNLKQENKKLLKDVQTLENKHKKSCDDVKKKTEELKKLQKNLHEYSKENLDLKQNIEELNKHSETNKSLNNEISSLNKQLVELSETLQNEKRNQVSLELYNEISAKYLNSTTELLNKKQSLQEVLVNLQETQEALRKLQKEKQEMRDQITKALLNLNREKEKIEELTKEKEYIKIQWNEASLKCSQLESELRESQGSSISELELSNYKNTENRAKMLKMELDNSYDIIVNLKEDLSSFQQQITNLEFQRCELTLKLHESEGHYETEKTICYKLRQANQHILAAILRMREEGKVGSDECNELLRKLQEEDSNVSKEHNLTKQDSL